MSPHPASKSSSSACEALEEAKGLLVVFDGANCGFKLEPTLIVGAGLLELGGGTELALVSDDVTCGAPLEAVCISPLAAVSLLVKEEIAHPAHEFSVAGLLMRGAAPPLVAVGPAGGSTVSGMV